MAQPARRTFLPGHVVVIICSITIQLLNLARTIHLERYTWSYYQTASFAFLGLLFLSYPLLGYIADVCLTRYRTIKCSFIFLIVACVFGLLLILISILYHPLVLLDSQCSAIGSNVHNGWLAST